MSEKKDLTRIEDLSEFLHEDDPDVDKLLDKDDDSKEKNQQEDDSDLPSLDDLEDEQAPPDLGEIKEFREHEQDDDPTNPGLGTDDLESEDASSFEDSSSWDSEEDSDDNNDWGNTDDQDWSSDNSSEDSDDQWGGLEDQNEDEADSEFQESSLPEYDWDSDGPQAGESEPELDPESQPDFGLEPGSDLAQEEEVETEGPESEAVQEPEPEPEPEPETPSPSSPAQQEERPRREPPEKFDDIKQFAQTMSYGHVGAGGNPPFSVMLKNIKYKEDAEEILALLKEHQIIDEQNLANYQQSLDNGALLISQISEYSAVYLAHRLRRFDLDVMVGLADEIHPSKSYEASHKGLMSKHNLRQNKEENVSLKQAPDGPDQILVSTTPGLEGHRIHKYLGIVTEHSLLKESDLEEIQHAPQQEHDQLPLEREISEVQEKLKNYGDHEKDDDELVEKYAMSIQQVYGELIERLKSEAIKLRANAVVGISFHLTPLIDKKEGEIENMYKITCTGNAIWASAQGESE